MVRASLGGLLIKRSVDEVALKRVADALYLRDDSDLTYQSRVFPSLT